MKGDNLPFLRERISDATDQGRYQYRNSSGTESQLWTAVVNSLSAAADLINVIETVRLNESESSVISQQRKTIGLLQAERRAAMGGA